ncbi:MAG TPA: DUF3341 domain-containing protein [Deltaproteobacteria bacterium]|nr:hypothetical protein [Deltaproteobacteria bacterium]HCP46913.1 DUF3341 domain-containing protein [Deltaproteobacteria bacterium]|tara:strand:- start:236 stop:778 length:543 start_codon:yes stop_codon:yes gene_type:complete
MSDGQKLFGALAEFANPAELFHACEKVRDAGYGAWDAHTPFPVHNLDRAMGLGSSKVPWICLVTGLSGAIGGFLLQVWVSMHASPLVISAKPLMSWQAFVPVTFELGVLCAAAGAVIGMLFVNRLPHHHSPLFESERFKKASDDGFFISIEAEDPKFDREATAQFLQGLGASHVELIVDG